MEKYFLLPGGNPTMLVNNLSTKISRDQYAGMSKELMQEEPQCEQVGFIEKGKKGLRCQMMGGEFCVNALRSLAYWNYQINGKTTTVLESSGTEKVFTMQVHTWVAIELEKKFEKISLETNLMLIRLEGIAHFVLQIHSMDWDEKIYRQRFVDIQRQYQEYVQAFGAVGLICVDTSNQIYPLVYVKETDTFIYESACGSGTLAVFITGSRSQDSFLQPSGSIYTVQEKEEYFILNGEVKEYR